MLRCKKCDGPVYVTIEQFASLAVQFNITPDGLALSRGKFLAKSVNTDPSFLCPTCENPRAVVKSTCDMCCGEFPNTKIFKVNGQPGEYCEDCAQKYFTPPLHLVPISDLIRRVILD